MFRRSLLLILAPSASGAGLSDAVHEPIVPTQTLSEPVEAGTVKDRERLAAAEAAALAELEPIKAPEIPTVAIEEGEPKRSQARPPKASIIDISEPEPGTE